MKELCHIGKIRTAGKYCLLVEHATYTINLQTTLIFKYSYRPLDSSQRREHIFPLIDRLLASLLLSDLMCTFFCYWLKTLKNPLIRSCPMVQCGIRRCLHWSWQNFARSNFVPVYEFWNGLLCKFGTCFCTLSHLKLRPVSPVPCKPKMEPYKFLFSCKYLSGTV